MSSLLCVYGVLRRVTTFTTTALDLLSALCAVHGKVCSGVPNRMVLLKGCFARLIPLLRHSLPMVQCCAADAVKNIICSTGSTGGGVFGAEGGDKGDSERLQAESLQAWRDTCKLNGGQVGLFSFGLKAGCTFDSLRSPSKKPARLWPGRFVSQARL